MKLRINKGSIAKLIQSVKAKRLDGFLWDTKLTGWGLKCSANMHMTWVIKQGNKRTKIAGYEILTIPVARERARELLKFKPRGSKTLGEAVLEYIEARGQEGRHRNEQALAFHNNILPGLNPNRPLTNLRKADIVTWLDTKSPGARPNLFAALNPFFKWCEERELIALNPLEKVAPPTRAPSRERVLNDDELKAFWRATDFNEQYNNLFRFLLTTCTRRNEAALAKQAEFELRRKLWLIPAHRSKNGKAFEVHLTDPALGILERQQHAPNKRKGYVPFVFGLTGFSGAKERLDAEMQSYLKNDLSPWRLHDLRRTAATRMQELGVRREVIEALLNHTPPKLVGTYQTHTYPKERREALQLWAAELRKIVT